MKRTLSVSIPALIVVIFIAVMSSGQGPVAATGAPGSTGVTGSTAPKVISPDLVTDFWRARTMRHAAELAFNKAQMTLNIARAEDQNVGMKIRAACFPAPVLQNPRGDPMCGEVGPTGATGSTGGTGVH